MSVVCLNRGIVCVSCAVGSISMCVEIFFGVKSCGSGCVLGGDGVFVCCFLVFFCVLW